MDQVAAQPSVRRRPTSRPSAGLLCWTVVFSTVATAGLGVLTWGLIVLHALSFGMLAVLFPEAAGVAPDPARYGLAFGVGVTVHVACTATLTWLVPLTGIGRWPIVAQGLVTSVVAAPLGCSALLLTLGIDPVGLLLGF